MNTRPDFDVIIVGGSFAGLALAVALSQTGQNWRVAVLDRNPFGQPPGGDSRAVALTTGAQEFLRALGLWSALAEHAQPVSRIAISDTPADSIIRLPRLAFDTADAPTAWITENSRLRAMLLSAAQNAAGVNLRQGVVAALLPQGGVTLAGQEMLHAPLVVAADGASSALRAMAGIGVVRWPSTRAGIVATLAITRPHDGVAVQHFLPPGPFAALPMTGDRLSLVWTEAENEARRIAALPEPAFIAEAEKRLGGGYGEIRRIGQAAVFPLGMVLARRFAGPGIVLIGDAAHALHWLAGQGLNHALKDVAALAECLVDARALGLATADAGALARYQRWRRFDASSAALGAATLERVFGASGSMARGLRDVGLGLIDRAGPLKTLMMREAAGQTGHAPMLWRGLPLSAPRPAGAPPPAA